MAMILKPLTDKYTKINEDADGFAIKLLLTHLRY